MVPLTLLFGSGCTLTTDTTLVFADVAGDAEVDAAESLTERDIREADSLILGTGGAGLGTSVACLGGINDGGSLAIGSGAPDDSSTLGALLFATPLAQLGGVDAAVANVGPSGVTSGAGRLVAAAGDIDDDDRTDWWIGSPIDDFGRVDLFGGAQTGSLSLSDALTTIRGVAAAPIGSVVLGGEDVNNDGQLDVLLGAADVSAAFVLEGPLPAGVHDVEAEILEPRRLDGPDGFGRSLTTLAIDGGSAIIAVGAPDADSSRGQVQLFANDRSGTAVSPVATIFGASGDEAGASLAAPGDLDGDGVADLLIGAPGNDRVYVLFGPFAGTIILSELGAAVPGVALAAENQGDRLGAAVTAAGDVDGDGLDDLLLAAPQYVAGEARGTVYVVWGAAIDAIADDASVQVGDVAALALRGTEPGDRVGVGLARGCDLDRDGLADVVVSADGIAGVGVDAGGVFVFQGMGLGGF